MSAAKSAATVIVVSESSIVSRAIEHALADVFSQTKRFARLADIDPESDWRKVLVIYDLSRPAEDVEAILNMKSAAARDRMVVLTKETQNLRDFVPLIGKVGAIVPHSSDLKEITLIARLTRAGLLLLPSEMISFLQLPPVGKVQVPTIAKNLTERETSVLGMLAKGYGNKVIARDLGINDTTVRVHVRSVLKKIGVHNRTEAALLVLNHRQIAMQQGQQASVPLTPPAETASLGKNQRAATPLN